LSQEKALVLKVEDGFALLQTQRASACQSCNLQNTCGQGLLSKVGGEKTMEFTVANQLQAKAGDVVLIEVPENGLLYASALMFLMPLVMMLALAVAGHEMFGTEMASLLAGAVGLFIGFALARYRSRAMSDDPRFQPEVKSILLGSSQQGACKTSLR
jgi:sigma-E factor negative regulatory protein RseC